MSDNANAIQIGGQHYKKQPYQHWDFALDHDMGYLEAMVAKYVSRHRDKNKRQDLEKAYHFLQKLREEAGVPLPSRRVRKGAERHDAFKTLAFILENEIPSKESYIISKAVLWRTEQEIEEAMTILGKLMEEVYPVSDVNPVA